jgi:hypothetical protein
MGKKRVRYDRRGEPKKCTVHIPPHLAKILYGEALKARQGKGEPGDKVQEKDIVIDLIERWAKGRNVTPWAEVIAGLKAEAASGLPANAELADQELKK